MLLDSRMAQFMAHSRPCDPGFPVAGGSSVVPVTSELLLLDTACFGLVELYDKVYMRIRRFQAGRD